MKTDVKSCTFLAAYAARQSVYLLLILKINTPKIVFQNIKEKQPQKLNPSSIDNQSRFFITESCNLEIKTIVLLDVNFRPAILSVPIFSFQ